MKYLQEHQQKHNLLRRVKRLLRNPENVDKLHKLYMDFIGEFQEVLLPNTDPWTIPVNDIMSYSIDIKYLSPADLTVTLQGPGVGHYYNYSYIENVVNEVAGGTAVNYRVIKKIKIGKVTFKLDDYISAVLPDEEIALLTKLGKVKTDCDTTVTQSIFCETGISPPSPPF